MNNIIWNEKELKKIKQIILTRANLRLNDNFELVLSHSSDVSQLYNIKGSSIYEEVSEELIELFYINDREKISNILAKASQIKVDLSNRFHIGIISTLSKMNPENHVEIFNIFKEIVAQYNKSASAVAHKVISELDSVDAIKAKIKEIKDSTEETIEEKLVKNDIRKVFTFSNGVTDSDLFASLIEKLNSKIKIKLLTSMTQLLNSTAKTEINNKEKERGLNGLDKRFKQKNMNIIKQQKIKVH